jgi:hypothetical protein
MHDAGIKHESNRLSKSLKQDSSYLTEYKCSHSKEHNSMPLKEIHCVDGENGMKRINTPSGQIPDF